MDKRPSTFREDLTGQDHHQVIFKQGKPDDHDLDELAGKIAAKWQELGLRLEISQDKLDEIDANEKRKAYWMLIHWRNTTASATLYCDLYHALCHDRVGLNNVAKEFCVSFQSSPQNPKRPRLTSEDEAGSSGHGRPPSSLEDNKSPFLAGPQTPVQIYQTSHPHSSSGYQPSSMEYSRFPSALGGQTLEGLSCADHSRPYSSAEYSQLPFVAVTQETTGFRGHGSSPSLLEYNQLPFLVGHQTPVQTYMCQTSHPQSFSGYRPSSVEYSTMFPSALGGQTHKGPSYQTWHSPISFQSSPQDPKRPRLTSADKAGSSGHGSPPTSLEYNKSPIPAGSQTPMQIYQTSHPHSSSGYQPSSMEYSRFPSALGGQTLEGPKSCPADMFDVKTCQRKLAEHYQKTAKVPTTAWSSVLQVDLEKIYTRLSWVKQEHNTAGSSQNKKEEQTTAGLSQKELNHYTEIFTDKTTNGVVAKRILVQGETGIGKTTFVKKLLVDWSNLEEAKIDEERKDAIRKFDLVVSINLKEVSKCQTFKEVITRSGLFPEDNEKSVDDMLCYIRANQDKVLLVFDGYDEYRTGSEAEERYGNRSSSEIFKIFHGNILRDCTVLVTTRSSRADEIRVPADIEAEITGFNMLDREDFMRKMLDSQSDVDGLLQFLRGSELNDLARVPLLSLFFCLLWKSEKEKLMELTKRKAKLYQAIVKHILQHSHRRRSSSKASKLKESDYEEILAEIGKVALAGLLKGDLVFEFGQLSEKVRGEEGVIVGLFQFSEYGQSLEPTEMVSFIHKSIQEYLAAWYLIYSCVPKGSLGEIEQHTPTLENYKAWENVFQFVCGLSDEGAKKVLEHLTSVRMSDPTLDFSKMIPDVETETEVPVCDVTDRHERFSNLVYDSFQEVQSKVELFSNFLHCTGGVILVSDGIKARPITKLIPDVNVLTKLTHNFVFSFMNTVDFWRSVEDTMVYKLLDFLKCLQNPLRVTDSSEVLTVEDIIRKLHKRGLCFCMFRSILCFLNGQFQFYITKLQLECNDHARVFTKSTTISVPCNAASLCSEASCLKFLSSLSCRRLSNQTAKGLGAVIGNCRHLSRIKLLDDGDSICYLLEQVRCPSKCSVKIIKWIQPGYGTRLTSVGAVQLASLLSKFNNVVSLDLDLKDCCAAAVETLVTSITHKTLNTLALSEISLTPAASKALGRSLPEMSSLQGLRLIGSPGSTLEAEEMEALFGGFNKAMPLCDLTIEGFSVRSPSPLIKCLSFFPDLRWLYLNGLNIDESDQYRLLKSFGFLTKLKVRIHGETSLETSQASFKYKSTYDTKVKLDVSSLTPALAATLGRMLPELSSLKSLKFEGYGSILKAASMKALFGGFNKAMPLCELTIGGFSVTSCLSPIIKCLPFLPDLRKFQLQRFNIHEYDQCRLLKSFGFLTELAVHILGERICRASFSYYTTMIDKVVKLNVITLTPAVAAMLGRILPELPSLKSLEVLAKGSVLKAASMEALFGGFNKTMPLHSLMITGSYETGGLAPLFRSFRFFPNLLKLTLEGLNMDEHDLRGLLESFQFIPNLQKLDLSDTLHGHAVTSIVPHVIHLKKLRYLTITDTGHSEEDLNYVRDTVQQALPELEVITVTVKTLTLRLLGLSP